MEELSIIKDNADKTKKAKKKKNSENIWDSLLTQPESNSLLQLMAEEAKKEYNAGKTEEGGFA
jgi:pyruvate dehydrogenase complex dehydrogenase (E1) component